jgi:endonuclease-3
MPEPSLSYNRSMRGKKTVAPDVCERIELIWQRLQQHYGAPPLHPNDDPVGELVSTILSQHTTDRSSWAAYQELRERYPTWDMVRQAPIDELANTIRGAGLPVQKARTIQLALTQVDGASLDSLTTLPVADARARLTAIRGIGDKTASCVLLFSLGMPAQPVDTHIQRDSTRLGITNGETSATGIKNVYEHCLPPDGATMYAFHVDMVRHGREICQAREPKCSMCMLTDVCEYYARITRATTGE